MAPLTSQELRLDSRNEHEDSATFSAPWNEIWTIGVSPQGGYSLSLMIQAAQAWVRLPSTHSHPTAAPHIDPLHVSATFVYPQSISKPLSIVVKPLKRGKGVTLAQVDLTQENTVVLTAKLYLTNFAARRGADPPIKGPSFPSHPCPLTKPGEVTSQSKHYGGKQVKFRELISMRRDDAFEERNKGKVAGAWFEITGDGERDGLADGKERGVGYHWLPIFCDMYLRPPEQRDLYPKGTAWWYPTLSLSIEYKRSLPQDVLLRRWGEVSWVDFTQDGQYDNSVQIWSHPADNHLLDPSMREEDGPQILAIARQVALSTPLGQQGGEKRRMQARSTSEQGEGKGAKL
ncbi:hypothetical protein BDZ90DRAFT_232597 [Jaminaea rosea]|uniref:Acyl-CoA thioesterase-like N-terminal HotDog domain-containing protein n=1 Tax=Jaminaea rosea TaxID=1569628 RepID=A0A316UP21_9BASI|nr:hypothetical protein BDZ90DRAFT_232597 [Jaminaea rosea]PWN27020.1 hypothetical protein BDZ90DRAFT_232597 [Jaminaea rosea]